MVSVSTPAGSPYVFDPLEPFALSEPSLPPESDDEAHPAVNAAMKTAVIATRLLLLSFFFTVLFSFIRLTTGFLR
jgi:hypothetical protein